MPITLLALGLVSSLANCLHPKSPPDQPRYVDLDLRANQIWLDSLDLSTITQDWGTPRAGRSVDDKPLTIAGKSYRHGVGTHAVSEWTLDLHGSATAFDALVGIDDEVTEPGSAEFLVIVDGVEKYRSGVVKRGEEPRRVHVDLTGARQLILAIDDAGDSIDRDHADWASATLTLVPDATQQPESLRMLVDIPNIVFPTPDAPAIYAPRITGASTGKPFLFRIPATGAPPLRFAADGLPNGLALDPTSGIITGAGTADGRHNVRITVDNAHGRAESTLTIVLGDRPLALTPPMGWNSWNVWGTSVDDAKVRAAADHLVSSGLAAHGFQYVNIDDAWEGQRDADGRIQTNEKFPDMKALADYVHAKGLKLGIYSSPGPKTCAQYEGSYQHELLDAQSWAAWGIDLVKYDWCSYGQIAPKNPATADYRKPYEVMRDALRQVDRDIVYSLCQYGMGEVSKWGAEVGGNYWRTTGDIVDTWASMSRIGFGQHGLEPYAGPGHWNDPDMLVVGKVGWGPKLHDTRLKPHEQITHITLWSLLASPLLIGCDLSQLDDFTLALLTNPEVLEVNQDPLGQQASRIAQEGATEVWLRPLADGTHAAGLFNRGWTETNVTLKWSDAGLSGPLPLRDLWHHRDLGNFDGSFTTSVPRHGAVMLKIGTPR